MVYFHVLFVIEPLKDLLTPMTDKVKEIFVSPSSSLGPTATYTTTVTVDKTFNLLSALTMIAPSPDWCVGVSRVNFCTSQCGFIDDTTIDLFLWDAGTKAGPTEQYTYAGSATSVPIYQLKSTTNSSSVFYRANGTSLPPYAKLQISKVSQALTGIIIGHYIKTSPYCVRVYSIILHFMYIYIYSSIDVSGYNRNLKHALYINRI